MKRSSLVDQIPYVIFPDNKWIKRWDNLVLLLLFGLAFVIPYQIGVSGGSYLLTSRTWLVINVMANSVFFVDTFLYFWRAHKIKEHLDFCVNIDRNNFFILIKIFDVLKLIRFFRVKSIMTTSDVIKDFTFRHKSQYIELFKYSFLIAVTSHWFACCWSCVAFVEAGTFCEKGLLLKPNWIGYWYVGTYGEGGLEGEGGLNPLGWEQDTERYVLSLFWAVQTITSIGYGNIAPFTLAEWWTGCILQLFAGITWAYVIGGLVGVAAAMQVRGELYRTRIDEANAMIEEFGETERCQKNHPSTAPYGDDDRHNCDRADVARRIQKYIHKQHLASRSNNACASNLDQAFPVLCTLTPELRRQSGLLIMKKYLEAVPYLSSMYMSAEEQSHVALECTLLEFSAGEIVTMDGEGDFGRGIYILKRGSAYSWRTFPRRNQRDIQLLTAGMTFGDDKVLTEDGSVASRGALGFLTFARAIFIPRQAVLNALEGNSRAWKDCARWRYLHALLRDNGVKKAFDKDLQEDNFFSFDTEEEEREGFLTQNGLEP